MKCRKIVAMLVVLAMVFSTMIVLNKLDIGLVEQAEASTVPFVGGAYQGQHPFNATVGPDDAILDSDLETADLYYGNTLDLVFNETLLDLVSADGTDVYLYKPYYKYGEVGGFNAYWITWKRYAEIPNTDWTLDNVELNISGLWIVCNTTGAGTVVRSNMTVNDPSKLGYAGGNMSFYFAADGWKNITGWFWVNSTDAFADVEITPSTFYYDTNTSVTFDFGDDFVMPDGGAWIDIRKNESGSNGQMIRHIYTTTTSKTISADTWYLITHDYGAGLYDIYIYADDPDDADGDALSYGTANGAKGYNHSFGNWTNSAYSTMRLVNSSGDYDLFNETTYNYTSCGPFDPPEYFTMKQIEVLATAPDAVITSQALYYNGTDGEINITLTKPDGEYLNTKDANTTVAAGKLYVRLYNYTYRPGKSPSRPVYGDYFNITNGSADGWISIELNNTGGANKNRWGWNATHTGDGNIHGLWAKPGKKIYIVVNYSSVGNETEEWNVTLSFTLLAAQPHIKWVDDDGAVWNDANDDGIIPYIPAVANVPLDIKFKIFGADYQPWGTAPNPAGGEAHAMENITISGDSLFTGTLDNIPNVGYAAGTWTVPIIPLMNTNGGTIAITVTAFNTTLEKTLTIGGSKYWQNGSIVTVTPNEFMIDVANQTLAITVQTATGANLPTASASLYYIDDGSVGNPGEVLSAAGKAIDTVTADADGKYTMIFNLTQQTDNQTTAQADLNDIKAPRNLTVYAHVGGAYCGYALVQLLPVNDLEVELSETTILAGQVYEEFTITCTVGGNDTPSEDDKAKFFVEVYDEEGNDVTDTLLSDGGFTSADLTNDDDYVFELDDLYVLEAGTYTFYCYNNTHTSEGNNATLVVEQVEVTCDKNPLIWSYDDNISATFTITYNGNPINGSLMIENMTDVGDYNLTWANESGTGNDSLEIEDIVNGVVTVSDITAEYLHPGEAEQYISFWFAPDEGEYALASTQMLVAVPTVTPDKEYIPLGRTSTINCEVTGRGSTLNGIYVRLHGQGVDTNGTSDSLGMLTFSIIPNTNGNISIDVGEEGRTIDTVIVVTNWVLDISADSEVDEGDSFTVTVLREGTTTEVTNAQVTFNGVTDSEAPYTFTAPEVTSDRTYTITATAEGYAPDPDGLTITVINVPKLIISVDDEVTAGSSFEVVVAKDTGDACIGATVTFNGKEYKTKAGGVATITAPSEAQDYTITASFGDFTPATATVTVVPGGVPGFEVLTLIAALGVAFILLRRRKH
ncbi:MAG: hypothetical protein JW771_01690 [Candidatus Thermoplasmatota archaeon]|nr:hypothetical protein [Candidatus Thermoplasmatota archaeon]